MPGKHAVTYRHLPKPKCCRTADNWWKMHEASPPKDGFRIMSCVNCKARAAYLYDEKDKTKVVYVGTFLMKEMARRFVLYLQSLAAEFGYDVIANWANVHSAVFYKISVPTRSVQQHLRDNGLDPLLALPKTKPAIGYGPRKGA